MLAGSILDMLFTEHLLYFGPSHLYRGLVCARLVLLARSSMFLILAVFLNNHVIGDGKGLGIGIEKQVGVVGHAAQTGIVLTGLIVLMTRCL